MSAKVLDAAQEILEGADFEETMGELATDERDQVLMVLEAEGWEG